MKKKFEIRGPKMDEIYLLMSKMHLTLID